MTVLLSVPPPGSSRGADNRLARVAFGPAGLIVECPPCRVHLEQRPGADTAEALRAFLEAHPLTRHARHSTLVPPGWLPRLVGALSQ